VALWLVFRTAAGAEVESVLYGADVGGGSGDGELLERDIGDADVPDLALVLKMCLPKT
jgi:hypothetical protein